MFEFADFYHTTSDQFLTYNRDKIKPEVNDETYEKVIRTLRKYIENKFDDFNETNQIYAAFSYILNLSDKKYDDIPFKFKEKALLFPVHIDDETIFLKDLIEKIKSEIFSEISVECKSVQYSSESKKIDKYIKNNISERLFHFIKFILTKDNLYYSEVNYHPNYKTIKISKEGRIQT